MGTEPTTISIHKIEPTDSVITQNIFNILNELFLSSDTIILEENNQKYTKADIEKLANDIVTLKENL